LLACLPPVKYGYISPEIRAEKFPPFVTEAGEVKMEILQFSRTMSETEIYGEMAERNLRPATIIDLLAFGKAFPQEQWGLLSTVALGSPMEHMHVEIVDVYIRGVPVLSIHCSPMPRDPCRPDKRSVTWSDVQKPWLDRWPTLFRFLAVKKTIHLSKSRPQVADGIFLFLFFDVG